MSNDIRTRDGLPFNFVDGLKIKGVNIEQVFTGPLGTSLIGNRHPFALAVIRTQQQINDDYVNFKNYGGSNDAQTDNIPMFNAAMADLNASTTVKTLYIPDGNYRTSSTIVVPIGVSVICGPGVRFIRASSSSKTFPCFRFQGTTKSTLGTIEAYGAGVEVTGDLNTVDFHVITNCNDAVVIKGNSADNGTASNNAITGHHVFNTLQGTVFTQPGNSTITNNRIAINSLNYVPDTVVFDPSGMVGSEKWGFNEVEYGSVNTGNVDARLLYIKSATHEAENITYRILNRIDMNNGSNTSLVLHGRFKYCNLTLPFAHPVTSVNMANSGAIVFFSTHVIKLQSCDDCNVTYDLITTEDSASDALFNGGVQLYRKRFRVRALFSDLNYTGADDAVMAFNFRHALSLTNTQGNFKIQFDNNYDTDDHNLHVTIGTVGGQRPGLVRIQIRNISGAALPNQNMFFIVEAGD